MPSFWGPASSLHRVIIAPSACVPLGPLNCFLGVFVYERSLLFLQLVSFECEILHLSLFYMKIIDTLCFARNKKKIGCFITKNIHAIRLLKFSFYFQDHRKEEESKYMKPKTIIKFNSEAPHNQGKERGEKYIYSLREIKIYLVFESKRNFWGPPAEWYNGPLCWRQVCAKCISSFHMNIFY